MASEKARLAWACSLETLMLKVDMEIDDDAQVITMVPGTQLELELEFEFRQLISQYGCFDMLDTTVTHGGLWCHTMLEAHDDVGDEVRILIETVAANHYRSGTR